MSSKNIILSLLLLSGCISEHTGSTTTVGEEIAWPEVSNSSESFKVRIFQTIKGAKVWTAKDCSVTVEYRNSYTNSYFGLINMVDSMELDVTIEPLDTTSNLLPSNCLDTAGSTKVCSSLRQE